MAQPYAQKMIFVRHGQTSYNAENRLQGQRDVPLDGKGREQAGARSGASCGTIWAKT